MEESSSRRLPVSSRNIEIMQWFVIGIVIYLIVSKEIRKYFTANQYGKAGNDPITNQAIAIRQACNPSGITWMIDFDTTSLSDLMSVADQISAIDKVGDAYRNLYNENMFERLEKELNNEDLNEWLKRARSVPTKAPAQPAGTQIMEVKLLANKNTTVFEFADSSKIAKTVASGEVIGMKKGAWYITSKGVQSLYYVVEWTSIFGLITHRGYVLAADTKQQ